MTETHDAYLARKRRERTARRSQGLPILPFPEFVDRIQYAALDECWQWRGCIDRLGYGRVTLRDQALKAHRYAHMLWIGPIPTGYEIDHLCSVRSCVNPRHLEAVTKDVNYRRMAEQHRMGLAECRKCGASEWQFVLVNGRRRRRCGACNRHHYWERKTRSYAY